MSGKARRVESCRTESPSPAPFIFPSHLHSSNSPPPPNLFYLCISSLVTTFSFEFVLEKQDAAHICAPRDTLLNSDFITFIHTERRCWLSDDLENAEQSDEPLLVYKQLPTTSGGSEALQTRTSTDKAGTQKSTRYRVCSAPLSEGWEEEWGKKQTETFYCLTRCRRLAAQWLDNSPGGASVQRAWHPPIGHWFHHTTLCKRKDETDRGVQGLFGSHKFPHFYVFIRCTEIQSV